MVLGACPCPFVTQLLVLLIGRPAKPSLVARRRMPDEAEKVAGSFAQYRSWKDIPSALVRWFSHRAATDDAAPIRGRKLGVDVDLPQPLCQQLHSGVEHGKIGRLQNHDR